MLVVADCGNNALRAVRIEDYAVATIAGDPEGFSGDQDGGGDTALLREPFGVCVDAQVKQEGVWNGLSLLVSEFRGDRLRRLVLREEPKDE